jgi:hypothetical protein
MRSRRMGSCCEDCYPVQQSHSRKIRGDTLSILSMRGQRAEGPQIRSRTIQTSGFGLVR